MLPKAAFDQKYDITVILCNILSYCRFCFITF